MEAEKNKKSGSEILGFIVIHLNKMYFDVHNFDELLLLFLKKVRSDMGISGKEIKMREKDKKSRGSDAINVA